MKDGTVPVAQWHLSVEDPILPLTCSTPVDLGKSLTMHGQLQVFRVLRRAHCGTRALLTANPTEAVQGALLLFDRQGLIKLSLNGGYESEIRPTPTWRFTFNLRLLHDKAADRGPAFAPERSASNDSGSAASTSSGSCISVSPQSAPTPDSYYAHQSLSQQHAMYNQQQQQFRQGQGQGGFLPTRPSPDQQQLQQQRYAQQQQLQQQQQAYGLHGVPGLALGGQSGASRTSSNGLGQGQGQNGLYAGYQGQQQLGGKGAPHHPGTQTQIQNQGPGQTSGQGQGQGPTSAGKYGALLNGRMGQQQQQQQQQRQSFETQPSANVSAEKVIYILYIKLSNSSLRSILLVLMLLLSWKFRSPEYSSLLVFLSLFFIFSPRRSLLVYHSLLLLFLLSLSFSCHPTHFFFPLLTISSEFYEAFHSQDSHRQHTASQPSATNTLTAQLQV